MGTTLTNGIYLPNEGEKNCYAGLKINWETLDQKIADITALQQAVAGALHREIVASLPTTDINPNTIYMILSGTSATENVYDEYMYVNNAWELIGTSATDLTNYYTKAEVDGKLLLKANASDLTSHTGDTTIHVTANDKTKWTNSANTHVLRLALSALTPSTSDNSFSNLDDSTALKVGDKVMDTAGVLFEVTAIDTQNSTFTIGTALIDLAQDSDVVHKSGDESVIGSKRFGVVQSFTGFPTIRLYSTSDDITVLPSYTQQQDIRYTDKNNNVIAYFIFQHRNDANEPFRTCWRQVRLDGTDGYYSVNFNNLGEFYPENNNAINLGRNGNRWKSVYATNYYYGSNNVEFSTKFVTTDTNQTISGQKVFDDINTMSSASEIGVSGGNRSYKVLDKNKKILAKIEGGTFSSGMAYSYWLVNTGTDLFNGVSLYQPSANLLQLRPYDSTLSVQLGATNRYFSNCYTSKINGLNPSSLSLPDLSNGIDISSYITIVANANKESLYTPPANGWICVRLSRTSGALGVMLIQGNMASSGKNIEVESGVTTADAMLPVVGGVQVSINSALADGVVSAYFYPCQGNV